MNKNQSLEPVWDFQQDWLEYNKDNVDKLIKVIKRKDQNPSKHRYQSEETYIVFLFENILEEFTEPFYGYLRFNMTINNVDLPHIQIQEKLKYYFWINVSGVSSYAESDENMR